MPELYDADDVNLEVANSTPLRVIGKVIMDMNVGNQTIPQEFVVVDNLNRNVILGEDWLVDNGIRMYYDMKVVRINGEYISLDDDIHISSIVRLDEKVVLKPQHAHTCQGIMSSNGRTGAVYELEQLRSGHLSTLSGVSVASSIVKMNETRRIPLAIINNTNQTISLKKGWPIATLSELTSVNSISHHATNRTGATNDELEQAEVPQ